MVTFVIFVLSFVLTSAATAIGWSVTHFFWIPKGPWELAVLCMFPGAIAGMCVQYLFRKRDNRNPIRWYEFTRDGLIGIGAMIAFDAGAVFSAGNMIAACFMLTIAFILTAKACVVGPWQGWDAYIGPRAIFRRRAYPYPTPPSKDYVYDR